MKKASTAGLLVLLALGAAVPAEAQTAGEILERMIDAQGGRKVLGSLRDSILTGTVEMVSMGMNGGITITQKEPNKMRMDIEVMGTVISQAFDGEKAWFTNPQTGSAEEMTGRQAEDFKNQALGSEAFLNPEKYGLRFALKGREKVGSKEYFLLELSFTNGPTSTLYVDAATYLTYKAKGTTTDLAGNEVEAETLTEDYRKVGGIMVAHKLTVFQNGAEFVRMTFAGVVFNKGVDDDAFRMPR